MSNISIFESHLQKNNIHLEEIQMEDGSIAFRGRESLKGGGNIIFVIVFNNSQDIVDIKVLNIANIDSPLKKEAILDLINELNMIYRYSKFYINDGAIDAEYSLRLGDNQLDPQILMSYLILLINAAEESYPKFMKLQWG